MAPSLSLTGSSKGPKARPTKLLEPDELLAIETVQDCPCRMWMISFLLLLPNHPTEGSTLY